MREVRRVDVQTAGARGPIDAAAWLASSREWFEATLRESLKELHSPAPLAEALRYALDGGKRLRPTLVRTTCRWLGGTDADAEIAALAIEHVHAYSLVHDDLPCMDDDALRHGRPSCHVQFGEALAVLVGDALLTRAFALLAPAPRASAASAKLLANAAGDGGMVGGQVLDLTLQRHSTSSQIERMHALKTAALMRASCELGALSAGAREGGRELTLVGEFGEALGLCFQALDDVLDVTADQAALGKTPGKDQKLGKATLVAALGLDGARGRAREHAERARVAALELGGESAELGLALIEHLLDRRR